MSAETTTDTVAQLQQQYEAASSEQNEHKATLNKTNELLLHLEAEKETLQRNSKKREEEEEEQWITFQTQYDNALKDKQQSEVAFHDKEQGLLQLQHDKEKIMELKTNKETEEQMAQWQEEYNDAITSKDEAEYTLHIKKERLSELREIQSVYLKKREEEDAEMWREFQERYDAALVERTDCEAVLKVKEEEMVRLQGEMMKVAAEELKGDAECSGDASSSPLDVSVAQSHEGEEEEYIGEIEGEDVTLITDLSAIVSNSDATETPSVNNTDNSIEDNQKGEVSTITESQHNVNNNHDDGLDETRPQEETSIQNPPNHMMAYGDNDDDTSLGATTISSSVSRAIEYKKDLSALDKFLPPAEDEISFVSGRSSRSTNSRSVSSRSVRRRDVIKPIALDEKSNTTLPSVKQEAVFVANIDGTVEEKPLSPWASSNHVADVNANDKIVDQSNPQCDQQFALVVHDPTQKAPRPTNLEPEEGRAALHMGNDPPGETPNERPYIDPNDDAINDSSSCSYIGGGRRRNVQWVDPKNVHDEDIDYGLLNVYERMAGRAIVNDQSSAASSFKQQRMADPPEDLPRNNYYPEEDDSSSNARMTKASILRDNRRIRIATISSGYKTANYFVREDLDTRIYFHELEDAINYMSRRGYARMKKEDEEEWIKLIGRAHGVVKIGPTKKKQRYRKGKLVMILSKEINDNDDDEYKKSEHCDSSEVTEHTSLGRSVRCGFKSYSEKFLAEQEAAKQSTLLQLTNGDGVDGAGHLLQLTNGEVLSSVDEATLESSKDSMGSDRKGVYGGGVRYFTSDNNDDESDDHSSDEDGSEEEEEPGEEFDEEFDEDESDVYQEEQEEMYEVEGSMGSMFSDEDIFRDNRSAGVDSMSASSTLTSGYPAPLQRKETYREPPHDLAAIDNESATS